MSVFSSIKGLITKKEGTMTFENFISSLRIFELVSRSSELIIHSNHSLQGMLNNDNKSFIILVLLLEDYCKEFGQIEQAEQLNNYINQLQEDELTLDQLKEIINEIWDQETVCTFSDWKNAKESINKTIKLDNLRFKEGSS